VTFPLLGGLSTHWFHEFVGSTLLEMPETLEFSIVPLLTSLVVALGGLYLGWLVYRQVPAGATDPLRARMGSLYTLLQNKYYIDELYDFLFVRPAKWLSDVFTYRWVDRGLIDGFLHTIAWALSGVGTLFRNWIDKPVVNGFGDLVGEAVKWIGRSFRFVQTGRVQQYMVMALVIAFGTLFYYLYFMLQR